MKLNLRKCIFGLDSGKLLGFIVSHRGNKVETKNIDAIINMPPPKNISQLCSLQRKIQAIHHFIESLANQTLPFTKILKKEL